jgi:hypothetical protein
VVCDKRDIRRFGDIDVMPLDLLGAVLVVKRRDGGHGGRPRLVRMLRQSDGGVGVHGAHMSDNRNLLLDLVHHDLQKGLSFFNRLQEALSGAAAEIEAADALGDQMPDQLAGQGIADSAILAVGSDQGGKNALQMRVFRTD